MSTLRWNESVSFLYISEGQGKIMIIQTYTRLMSIWPFSEKGWELAATRHSAHRLQATTNLNYVLRFEEPHSKCFPTIFQAAFTGSLYLRTRVLTICLGPILRSSNRRTIRRGAWDSRLKSWSPQGLGGTAFLRALPLSAFFCPRGDRYNFCSARWLRKVPLMFISPWNTTTP